MSFFTYSLFMPSQSLHLHVPDKKEEGCWSLYKTFPKQLCQRFPKLSPDSLICYKTHKGSEIIVYIIVIYYIKWIKSKVIKGKWCMWKILEETRYKLPKVLPQHRIYWRNLLEVLSNQWSLLSLRYQGFYCGVHHVGIQSLPARPVTQAPDTWKKARCSS